MAGRRRALIIATDEYLDPGLAKLRAPARDAEALAGALADPEIGDFQVDVLRNGTSSAIAERVDTLLTESKLDDLVVLHFSCHGIKDDSGELYLAATNTRPGLLPSTAVDSALVNRLMRRSRARRAVLFLDCCFGGAFERGLLPRSAGVIDVADQFRAREDELDAGRGRVVITSSNAMEFAFEGVDLAATEPSQPSIFTGALVEGLTTGAADRDQDGVVSLGELYEYVFERVRDATPNQTPGKWEFGLQGELVLAKNPQRIVVPAPLPPDLAELVENPFPGTRLGTIDVLVRLATGTDLPKAAGARNVLEQMVHDDSRGVAAAATEAVSKTSLSLSSTEVDVGTVHAGADCAAEVSLEGPPLAMASRVESSSPLILARRVDRVIRIEVDTSTPGPIEGTISITGAAGSAAIHVVGVVAGGTKASRPTTAKSQPEVKLGSTPPAPAAIASPAGTLDPIRAGSAQAETSRPSVGSISSARRLVERGWETGHTQTLIGAEIGGLGVWMLDLPRRADETVNASFGGDLGLIAKTSTVWIAAVIGAAIFLAWAGPARSLRIAVVLIVLYPVFHGLAKDWLYGSLLNNVLVAALIAALALVAATVVRFRRPEPQ